MSSGPDGRSLLGHLLILAQIDDAAGCPEHELPPGCSLELGASDVLVSGKTVLREVGTEATRGREGLLATLRSMRVRDKVDVAFHVLAHVPACSSADSPPGQEAAHRRVVVRSDLYLRHNTLAGLYTWSGGRLCGDLFSKLLPACPATLDALTAVGLSSTLHADVRCPLCHGSVLGLPCGCVAGAQPCDSSECAARGVSNDSASSEAGCVVCGRCPRGTPRSEPASASSPTAWQAATETFPIAPWYEARSIAASLLAEQSADEMAHVRPYKLLDCFAALPNWLVEAEQLPAYPPRRSDGWSVVDAMNVDALREMVARLPSVSALACTCRFMRAICSEVAPGLNLTLHPHQRAALKWMLARERSKATEPHPCQRAFLLQPELQPVVLRCDDGQLACDTFSVQQAPGIRGGILGDEPGLGKTITVIALIIKTRGQVAEPPDGAERLESGCGATFYMDTPVAGASKKGDAEGTGRRSSRIRDSNPGELTEQVYLSRATLVVVPMTLLNHWQKQVARHAAAAHLRLTVYGDQRRARSLTITAAQLATEYDIVLTTFDRLSSEWSPERRSSSLLLKVRWLRVILDEGHQLGANLAETNRLQMACALRAERRWMMTGTPTPDTEGAMVAHLFPLLTFLRCPYYSDSRNVWNDAVQTPFVRGQPLGRTRLMWLLQRCMIRASKASLPTRSLPPCYKTTVRLPFTPAHQRDYNDLVESVKRNLLLADWFDDKHKESLLCEARSKWCQELQNNILMACCIAGSSMLQAAEDDILETLQILARAAGVEEPPAGKAPPYVAEEHALRHIEDGLRGGAACERCAAHSRMLLVTPCCHLLCTDCISSDIAACPLPSCRKPYTMQSVDDPQRKATNPQPKWAVPMDLIELQPAVAQRGAKGISGGHWQPNWQSTESSKVRYLLQRLREIGAVVDDVAPEPVAAEPRAPANACAGDKKRRVGFADEAQNVKRPCTQAASGGQMPSEPPALVSAFVPPSSGAELPSQRTLLTDALPLAISLPAASEVGAPPIEPCDSLAHWIPDRLGFGARRWSDGSTALQHSPSLGEWAQRTGGCSPGSQGALTPASSVRGSPTVSGALNCVASRLALPQPARRLQLDDAGAGEAGSPVRRTATPAASCAGTPLASLPSRAADGEGQHGEPLDNDSCHGEALYGAAELSFELPQPLEGVQYAFPLKPQPALPDLNPGPPPVSAAVPAQLNPPGSGSSFWGPFDAAMQAVSKLFPDANGSIGDASASGLHLELPARDAADGLVARSSAHVGGLSPSRPAHPLKPIKTRVTSRFEAAFARAPSGLGPGLPTSAPACSASEPASVNETTGARKRRREALFGVSAAGARGLVNTGSSSDLRTASCGMEAGAGAPWRGASQVGGILCGGSNGADASGSCYPLGPVEAAQQMSQAMASRSHSPSPQAPSEPSISQPIANLSPNGAAFLPTLANCSARALDNALPLLASTSKAHAPGSQDGRQANHGILDAPQATQSHGSAALEAAADVPAPRCILRPWHKPHVRAKAIVYSRFFSHLDLLQEQLTRADVAHQVLRGYRSPGDKAAALRAFETDPCCGVLLMDDTGAVGLDLSFAQYVFLMEPHPDRSQESQIISRAHRLGAKRAVQVEVLVMLGTAEDAMMKLQGEEAHRRQAAEVADERGEATACALEDPHARSVHACWEQLLHSKKRGDRSMRNLVLLSLKHVDHTNVRVATETHRVL